MRKKEIKSDLKDITSMIYDDGNIKREILENLKTKYTFAINRSDKSFYKSYKKVYTGGLVSDFIDIEKLKEDSDKLKLVLELELKKKNAFKWFPETLKWLYKNTIGIIAESYFRSKN